MAMEIFKLVGSIFVDTDKANQSLQKTDKTAANVAAGIGQAAGAIAGVATAVIGTATAVGAAAIDLANDVAQQTDTIDKASIRMGISAEQYQELAYAAGQCGVEMSTMESAAKKLEGTGLNFDDAINQVMSLTTAEERSAKAAELFGEKVAYNLSPLIEQSTEDFDGLIQRANDLGLVMSGDAVKAGVEFGDLMSDLKQTFNSLKTQLGSAFIPVLNDLLKAMLSNVPQLQAMIKEFLPPITDFMLQFIPQMVEMSQNIMPVAMDMARQIFGALFDFITTLLPTALQLSQAVYPIMVTIITTLLPVALDIINSLLPLIVALLPIIEALAPLLSAILVPVAQLLSEYLPPVIDFIVQLVELLIPALVAVIEQLTGFIGSTLNRILGLFRPTIDAIKQIMSGIIEFITGVFTGDWEKAWGGIVKILKGFVNLIISYVEVSINSIIELVNTIIEAGIRLANLIPGVNINTEVVQIPTAKIPRLAKGGTIIEGGQAIVGEQGEELLTLPKGARVEPLNNNSIDYNKLTESFINALRVVAPEMAANVKVEGDRDNLVKVMVKANREAVNMNGRGLFA